MTGPHNPHAHAGLKPGWFLASIPQAGNDPLVIVEWIATVYDGPVPYCCAWGDTPAEAERRAVFLWQSLGQSKRMGGPG